MTRRSRLLTTATAGVAAALLLAGCGGGDGGSSKSNDKIAGADTGASASASPSASATSADTAGRPKITFPSDAKNVFEDAKTGDATKDAVLADSALGVNSVDEAIFKGSTGTKALGFYHSGKALESSITYVQGFIDDSDTWIGEIRFFDRKVTLSGAKQAYVTYCSDESKAFVKNKKTKKVDRNSATSNSYVLYHTVLTKNADGVWQTTDIVSNRGDKACQP
ncbi:hypothetical protein [Streptomyces hyaluromycini]|uniref:hypothetical protein n=1 Tax=Streptomyces hyaluromycini TaxID=1377993 RepID=UPI001238072E|nr:hypothetical protein [Streptomyces hyaluromycini]